MEQCKTLIPWSTSGSQPDEGLSRRNAEIPKPLFMDRRRPIPARTGRPESSRLTLPVLTAILVLLAGVYWMQPARQQGPITYRMGPLDGRFTLSSGDAEGAVREAAGIWSRAAGRELFREDPHGSVEVRFVYDYRQEASDKLKGMSGSISYTRSSYDALKARLQREDADYRRAEAALAEDVSEYNRQVASLNAEIKAASKKGMSEDAYRKLTSAQEELNGMLAGLQQRQEEQRRTVESLNSLVGVINDIAASLNLEVVRYNRTGSVLQDEFNEGLYEMKNGRETITIYHFTSRDRLVRVLAHEFGHALGISHVDNPRAIMYRLNQSDSLVPAPDDITALKAALKSRGI